MARSLYRSSLNKALATAKRNYKYSAKRKGRAYELSDHLFRELVLGSCFYCGAIPPLPSLHGIDRVDNTLGYVPGNVVTACTMCNTMKYTFSAKICLDQVRAISYNMALKTNAFLTNGDDYYGREDRAA